VSVSVGPGGGTTSQNLTLPGGEYGLYPQTKRVQGDIHTEQVSAQTAYQISGTSYTTNIYLTIYQSAGGSACYGYSQQRYITSSGEVFWIFMLVDRATRRCCAAWQSPDHPCLGNGGKPALVCHPFQTFAQKDYDLLVFNPNPDEVLSLREKAITDPVTVSFEGLKGFKPWDMVEFEQASGLFTVMPQRDVLALEKKVGIHPDVRFTVVRPDRDLLQVVYDEFDFVDHHAWPEQEVTVGLPPRVKIGKAEVPLEEVPLGTPITPYKRRIPYLQGMSVKALHPKG
jgi:hypothetical protein